MRQSFDKGSTKRVVARPDIMVQGYKYTCESGNVKSLFLKKQRRMKNKLKSVNKRLRKINEEELLKS